jgi:hypothetical protein
MIANEPRFYRSRPCVSRIETPTSSSRTRTVMYNWSETVRFYDGSGANYASFNKPTTWGASYGYHLWTLPINGQARPGSVCGEFKSDGVIVARVCHSIFA